MPPDRWGRDIQTFESVFPDWENADILLVGCMEERGSAIKGLSGGADAVRKCIYELSLPAESAKVVDLGNFKPKETPEAYAEMLAYVLGQMVQKGKTVLILGGSQEIVYGQFMAYEDLGRPIEYVHLDARFDVEDSDIVFNNHSYNHKIFLYKPNYLFSYTNLGYQSYFVSPHQRQLLKDLNFLAVRYGDINMKLEEAEPPLRTADMLSIDLSSVRFHEAPGAVAASPGGFSAMEICRIARYAGLAYRVSSVSFCEFSPLKDPSGQTALLVAMMCWYFTEGYYNRRDDSPAKDRSNLRKYAVRLHASIEQIHFYQHPVTDRWWMEVPYQHSLGKKSPQTQLIPCSRADYDFARTDDIPERWWLAYNKLK
ncbi:MAG: formimidoylglutamase [Bacteroidia bacterium]|nr:formimidoylglutamase [Bacteroidia bacterium]